MGSRPQTLTEMLLLSNRDDSACGNGLDRILGRGNQMQQIAQSICRCAKDQDRELPPGQVLLLGNVLVNRDKDIQAICFGSIQELTVVQSG